MIKSAVEKFRMPGRKIFMAIVSVAVLTGIVFTGCSPGSNPIPDAEDYSTTQTQTATQPVTEPPVIINPLTGLPGFKADAVGKRPVAVVVENHPDARPQWGFCSPDIVTEYLVEGGISRMVWYYADPRDIPKVGPMRSARHDFVEVAEGFDAIFVHWGWSFVAEDAIKKRGVNNLNGLNGKYFFRDKSRKVALEHTGYSNGESIIKGIADKNYNMNVRPDAAEPFKFAENASTAGEIVKKINFEFSSSYRHNFDYNESDKLYYNHMNGKPMKEDGGKQMAVTNVILLYLPVTSYNNTILREMDLTGGEGYFASGGMGRTITWKKGNTPSSPLKLYDSDGSELRLTPGKSYIGFVPLATKAKTSVSSGESVN